MFHKKKANPSAVKVIEKSEQALADECLNHVQEMGLIAQQLHDGWEADLLDKTSFIVDISKGREALRKTLGDLKGSKALQEKPVEKPRYQISSLFLKECWQYLISDDHGNERLHLVTGTVTEDGTVVLSRMEKVKLGNQSPAYVKADDTDAHLRIVSLAEDYDHLALAMFHSHVSRGAQSTSPSSIDIAFMNRMAKLGCDCLGGIFSLDGYVRFFSMNSFQIQVYGKGVKAVEDTACSKIFRITDQKQ